MSVALKAFFIRDITQHKQTLKDIADEYKKGIIDRHINFYEKIGGRVICAFSDDKLIGYYIYIPANKFLFNVKWLTLKIKLKQHSIDIEKATVPCFAFVTKKLATEQLYIEMLKHRIKDSKDNNYCYGIVGINQIQDINTSICKQRKWMEEIQLLANITETTYTILEYKHEAGESILIHRY
jgi:hypothetical protein